MSTTTLTAFGRSVVAVVVTQALPVGESIAQTTSPPWVRPRYISVLARTISATRVSGVLRAELDIALNNDGPESLAVSPSDFVLSVQGDMFGPRASEAGAATVHLLPRHSHLFRLTFAVPRAALQQATLFSSPADSRISGIAPLNGSPDLAGDGTPAQTRGRGSRSWR
jgi:hypothetical protein